MPALVGWLGQCSLSFLGCDQSTISAEDQMPSFVRNAGFALLVLACAACRDTNGPKSVTEAQDLWQSQNLSSYSYVATHECFCNFPPGPVTVEVTQGQVSRVIVLSTGAEIATGGWYTIDELFDRLRAMTVQPTSLTFDARLGYPRRIEICCVANDSGSIYTASTLFPAT
jgi:hypothetical protein